LAAIDDLIAQVEDEALRDRLSAELQRLTKEKKFGLVFEEHLPELTPVYSSPIADGSNVARRDGSLTDVWRVLSVENGKALCANPSTGKQRRMETDDLVVVRRFGEPIFPALIPVERVQNGADDAPWHTLIESDNYHALQLLEYLCAGQVDCIYIDPPYNTGARDWKYNNDYVDANDRWRHSKWLAMMRRRLLIAKRLLNPDTGVLIVTVDEHEVHHLGMLLEQTYPEFFRQMITIVVTPGGVTQQRFSRVEEHAIYCFAENAFPVFYHDDLLSADVAAQETSPQSLWQSLLRRGVGSNRLDRAGMFFPIHVDPTDGRITGIGDALPLEQEPDLELAAKRLIAWPIRSDGSLGRWRIGPESARRLLDSGFLKLGRYDDKRRTWTVLYLQRKTLSDIDAGDITIDDNDFATGAAQLSYSDGFTPLKPIKTVWNRATHHAGTHGSTLLRQVFGEGGKFSFPKSLYATRDAVAAIVGENRNALVLDFFAGSGTTLNAVNLLNAIDGGNRACILVTNNEVEEDNARSLAKQGHRPGDAQWEKHGICRSVTWPRSKYTITGQRDDGTELQGEYLTGDFVTKEVSRSFHRLGYIDPQELATAARKREIVSLVEGIPMSQIRSDTAFFVSETRSHSAAVLFDDTQRDAFVAALEDMQHVTDFYVVTRSNKLFQEVKTQITELLGPIEVQEEERRPMSDGFPSNLEYFRLDFLDKDPVALGHQFRAILPLLWLRAGAVGPRPELRDDDSIPAMVVPEQNPFAVLVDETRFADFQGAVAARDDLTHIFLITDSEEAFQEMAAQLTAPNIIQLYRDYLENFAINRGEA
jgi:adenine-specific DNA-methyltransferase